MKELLGHTLNKTYISRGLQTEGQLTILKRGAIEPLRKRSCPPNHMDTGGIVVV